MSFTFTVSYLQLIINRTHSTVNVLSGLCPNTFNKNLLDNYHLMILTCLCFPSTDLYNFSTILLLSSKTSKFFYVLLNNTSAITFIVSLSFVLSYLCIFTTHSFTFVELIILFFHAIFVMVFLLLLVSIYFLYRNYYPLLFLLHYL